MKTAEEWSRTAVFDIGTRSGILHSEFAACIKQIQLDAMKEGARRGAVLSIDPKSSYDRNEVLINRILSTAANWTEKDL